MCWRGTAHPFVTRASWKSIADKSWGEQYAALCDPAFKAQLLADPIERPEFDLVALYDIIFMGWPMQYPLRDDLNYEPSADMSIAAQAQTSGKDPAEYAYDLMMENNGEGIIYLPLLNYMDGNLDFVRELLLNENSVVSLSDGGAHCGTICDAASPTFMLSYWARDRQRGTIPLELAVKRQTRDTANLYGMHDRGELSVGKLADINIIDFENLSLGRPYVAYDLPAGGKRLLQKSKGYDATIKRGQITWRSGIATGARPGQVVRGTQKG